MSPTGDKLQAAPRMVGIVRRSVLGVALLASCHWAWSGHLSWWSAGWIAWILCGVSLEFAALANPSSGDTLSEHVWYVYSLSGWGKFAAWMLTAFLVWLAVHFVTRGRFG